MTYIYDILLNFNKEYYEFYDWNKDDDIVHIKKIPIYRIDDDDLINILYSEIVFDKEFLNQIKKKTEVFLKRDSCFIEYSCLLCGKEKILAIKLNNNGKIIEKSDLLIDEYGEIYNIIKNEQQVTKLNYIIYDKKDEIFSTRKMREINKFIRNELKQFDIDILSYIYYDSFLKNNDSKDQMINELMNIENKSKLYKMIKIITNKYKKIK